MYRKQIAKQVYSTKLSEKLISYTGAYKHQIKYQQPYLCDETLYRTEASSYFLHILVRPKFSDLQDSSSALWYIIPLTEQESTEWEAARRIGTPVLTGIPFVASPQQPTITQGGNWLNMQDIALKRVALLSVFPNAGKWLVFIKKGQLSRFWAFARLATKEGSLGIGSDVTLVPREGYDNNLRLVRVYTYNWQDKEDVTRISQELLSIGNYVGLYYKTEEDSSAGKYTIKGDKSISKYRA